jgi:Tol biopolymer transport system component
MNNTGLAIFLTSVIPLLMSESTCGEARHSQERTVPAIECTIDALPGSHEWSPDGSRLAVMSSDQGVQILALSQQRVTSLRTPPLYGVFAWAHQDDRLAILHSHGADEGELAIATLYLWHLNKDTPPEVLAQRLSANLKPLWSPDDKRILAQVVTGDLVVVDPMTGRSHTIYRRQTSSGSLNGNPVWIDNNRIAFQVGVGKLIEVNIRSGATRDLARNGLYAQLMSDGDGRLWALTYSEKRFRLGAVPDAGSSLLESDRMLSVDGPSRNGAFVTSFIDGSGFRIIDLEKGLVSTIKNMPGDSDPRWSPSGDRIAFSRVGLNKESHQLCVLTL